MSLVQSAKGKLDSVTLAPSLTGVTAGNSLLLFLQCSGSTDVVPTDSSGQTWTKVHYDSFTGVQRVEVACYWLQNANAGTHTLSSSGTTSAWASYELVEWTPLTAVDVVGSASHVNGTNSGISASGITTTNANDAVFAYMALGWTNNPANTITDPVSGYTSLWVQQDTQNNVGAEICYKEVTSTGAQSATWSMASASNDAIAILVSFKMAAGGGASITGAGQIASGEAFGTPTIGAAISTTGIASAQAFGSAAIGAGISTTGIASGEAFGLPVVAPAGVIAAGIPSAEAFGAPRLDAGISAAGIGSAEGFGAALIGAGVAPIGIATGEAVGVPSIAAGIAPAAIPGGEAFGAASLAASIQAAGISSGEAFGAPVVQSSGIFPVGISSAEAFGQPALAAAINAAGIISREAFGVPLVGDPPVPTGMLEIEIGQAAPRRQRIPERNFKPLLQRVLDAKYPRVKPAKERAQRRAKAIEQSAAQLIADDPQNEARFQALMREWLQERPVVPSEADLRAAFEAQVGFRLRQLELVEQARAAFEQERDDDDAIAVLLLLS